MDRDQVYEIIDGERNYQNSLNPNWLHDGKPTIEAEILMMEEYLKYARTAWVTGTTYGDDKAGLDEMRKVVGIAIRCFENHGVPERLPTKLPEDPLIVFTRKESLDYGSPDCN